MIQVALATICFLSLAPMVFSESVDGEWTTALHGRGPNAPVITLRFESNGNKLTGTLYAVQPIPLEGSIEGNALKITLRVATSRGVDLLLDYTATLDGD